jgi:hypothetical protein
MPMTDTGRREGVRRATSGAVLMEATVVAPRRAIAEKGGREGRKEALPAVVEEEDAE